jgi:Subtilase family
MAASGEHSGRLDLRSLEGRTGRGVRVAIIDSGVHASHPHVAGVASGVGIDEAGLTRDDFVDRLGHGTAVTAAIREKAPAAELIAIKIFEQTLTATGEALAAALIWAAEARVQVINLSLGTANQAHEPLLREAIGRAEASGALVVAAGEQSVIRWMPGSLNCGNLISVTLDWSCSRDACLLTRRDGFIRAHASGYPRPIPGVSAQRNLKGISFAVANTTGLIARMLEGAGSALALTSSKQPAEALLDAVMTASSGK